MPIDFDSLSVGDTMPEFVVQPTLRHAVMYAAAMWEFQRIHYDEAWARNREGLPGAVVQGPVLGNYLAQAIARWAGPEAVLKQLEWRNHALVAFGDEIRCIGKVVAMEAGDTGAASVPPTVRFDLEMHNQRQEKVVSGAAAVAMRGARCGAGPVAA